MSAFPCRFLSCLADGRDSQESLRQGDFPGGPVVKILSFQCKGVRIQSLVRELRSHLHCSMEKKKKKTNLKKNGGRQEEERGQDVYSPCSPLPCCHGCLQPTLSGYLSLLPFLTPSGRPRGGRGSLLLSAAGLCSLLLHFLKSHSHLCKYSFYSLHCDLSNLSVPSVSCQHPD